MNLQANTTNGERFALVVYDVPDKSGAPRPPSLMHRIAVRINWSCWLVPLANLPRIPVDEWKAAGADVEIAMFDDGDADNIVRLAKKGMLNEIAAMRKRFADSMDKASKLYAHALASVADEKRLKQADRQTYWALRRVRQSLAMAQEAAVGFDILGDFNEMFAALQHSMRINSEEMLVARSKVMVERTKAQLAAQQGGKT